MPSLFSITINPTSGYVGDVISIFSPTNEFDLVKENNVILFGEVPSGEFEVISTGQIDVKVPKGSVSESIVVKVNDKISVGSYFIVIFNEVIYENKTKQKGSFDPGEQRSPIYNKDLSITDFGEVSDENSILQNIYNIILTKPGERLFNPNFGCEIHDVLFDLIDGTEVESKEILDILKKSIELNESRAKVIEAQSDVILIADTNSLYIKLAVLVPSGIIRKVNVKIGVNK